MVQFRKAQPGDLDAIVRAVADGRAFLKAQGVDQWQNGQPSRRVMEGDIAAGQAYVAEEAGRVLGVAALVFGEVPDYAALEGSWGAEAPYASLHHTALCAEARGSGAAACLLAGAEALCRAAGVAWLRTDTHRHNRPMRRFLEKNGFALRGAVCLSGEAVRGGDPMRLGYDKYLASE